MKHIIFYHDGCDICSSVGQDLVNLVGLSTMEVVHVGLDPARMIEANKLGVKAYPALVTMNGNVLHFNVEAHEGSLACLV